MSDNVIQCAIRFKIKENVIKEYANDFFKEHFHTDLENSYDLMEKGKCYPVYINGNLYIDYLIEENYDYNVNSIDVTGKMIQDVFDDFIEKYNHLGFIEYKVKFLNFYNGGCSGLSEVE